MLIAKARGRQKPSGYTERHHITPRCMGGNDDPSNLVALTAREHYVAHLLLANIHDHNGLRYSVLIMGGLRKIVSRSYDAIRNKVANLMRGEANRCYGRYGERHPAYGRNHSVEDKAKIAKALTGKTYNVTDESREKARVWANDNNGLKSFKGGRIGGEVTSRQRYRCLTCGLVSSPGPIGRHLKDTKHLGRELVSK